MSGQPHTHRGQLCSLQLLQNGVINHKSWCVFQCEWTGLFMGLLKILSSAFFNGFTLYQCVCKAARGSLMKPGVCQRQEFLILMLILLFFKKRYPSVWLLLRSFLKLSKWQSSPCRRVATEYRLEMALANDTEHLMVIFSQ